jgi:hypothetical protein
MYTIKDYRDALDAQYAVNASGVIYSLAELCERDSMKDILPPRFAAAVLSLRDRVSELWRQPGAHTKGVAEDPLVAGMTLLVWNMAFKEQLPGLGHPVIALMVTAVGSLVLNEIAPLDLYSIATQAATLYIRMEE